jgi:hypothetical protein
MSAACDARDPLRCLLPWPSSAFTVEDPSTATGLRLSVDPSSFQPEDDAGFLDRADGFSRITGLATAFPARLDAASSASALRLLVAEPGSAWGTEIPLRVDLVDGGGTLYPETLLVGRPLRVLPAGAEHVVVVLDGLRAEDGASLEPDRLARVALGLDAPANADEAAHFAYHAPTRLLLMAAHVDPAHVLRLWDFTTRSEEDARRRKDAMDAQIASAAADFSVVADAFIPEPADTLAFILEGRLQGVPFFRDADGQLVLGDDDLPGVQGTHDVPFRFCAPAGEGAYRVVFYGHGTGGDFTDDAFDDVMSEHGIGKLGFRFWGWSEDDLIPTFGGFQAFFSGSARSTAGLLQATADLEALALALPGPLAELLAAESLVGQANPASGRRPDTDFVPWAGGSLGGTMGAVIAGSSPHVTHAVLNVPGAAWTHMFPESDLFTLIGPLMENAYGDRIDTHLAILAGQTAWDDVDGTHWVERGLAEGDVVLLQESMEDPILPNLGTEILAASVGAVQFDPALRELVGLGHTSGVVTAGAALEQFRVPDTGKYDVHGFAARRTPAGDAAREQIMEFLDSAWAGRARMEHPSGCEALTEDGSCDFSGMW